MVEQSILDAARARVASAETVITDLAPVEATARAELEAAKTKSTGDEPSAKVVLEARAALYLALERKRGAARWLDTSRTALRDAEHVHAIGVIEENRAAASRGALFDSIAPLLAEVGAIDAVPRVGLGDVENASALAAEHKRDAKRATLTRQIQRAAERQNEAARACASAASTLGADAAAFPVVTADLVNAALAIEVYASTPPEPEVPHSLSLFAPPPNDVPKLAELLAPLLPANERRFAAHSASRARSALRGQRGAVLDLFRSLVRGGSFDANLRAAVEARMSTEERETAEHNARFNATPDEARRVTMERFGESA